MTSVFTIGCNQELLLDVAEDNPYCVIISLAVRVFLFIYLIDFGYFVIFSSEEQIYLFMFIFTTDDLCFT